MGLFEHIRKGLARTRAKIASGLASVLTVGRKVDQALLEELRDTLLMSDVGPGTVDKLIASLESAWKRGKVTEAQDVRACLKEQIIAMWPEADRQLHFAESGPTVILVAGINGAGKTTSVAKLGHYLTGQGHKVVLGACDTYRAAAVEQLSIWSERIGVQIVKHQQDADPGAVAYDACEAAVARKADVLLIDTAGRLHTQDHLMRELGKIQKVVERKIPGAPHEVLLVLDATIGQNAVNQAKMFSEHVKVTGL
ncbi:MAG: signal recognition particle receptor subunit alpha, partial [Phycisphaerae bacterium]